MSHHEQARLRDLADGGVVPSHFDERGGEAFQRVCNTDRIRAENSEAGFLRQSGDLLLQAPSLIVRIGEALCDHDGGTYAVVGAFLKDSGHARPLHRDNGQIDGFRKFLQVRADIDTVDTLHAGIDDVDSPAVTEILQRREHAHRGIDRRPRKADDGDAPRLEEGV